MSSLVLSYYRMPSEADSKRLLRGQLCWAPAYYLPSRLSVLTLAHYNPKNEALNQYKVLPNPPADILFKHAPVKELNLEDDEEALVIKAKRRPVVILASPPASAGFAGGSGRLQERGYICVPLYSFHAADTQEFRARVRALEYPWWIYMPVSTSPKMSEGFARLDRVQVVEERLLQPFRAALTDEAVYFLTEWLRYHVTGEIEPLFVEDRKQMLAALPSAKPQTS